MTIKEFYELIENQNNITRNEIVSVLNDIKGYNCEERDEEFDKFIAIEFNIYNRIYRNEDEALNAFNNNYNQEYEKKTGLINTKLSYLDYIFVRCFSNMYYAYFYRDPIYCDTLRIKFERIKDLIMLLHACRIRYSNKYPYDLDENQYGLRLYYDEDKKYYYISFYVNFKKIIYDEFTYCYPGEKEPVVPDNLSIKIKDFLTKHNIKNDIYREDISFSEEDFLYNISPDLSEQVLKSHRLNIKTIESCVEKIQYKYNIFFTRINRYMMYIIETVLNILVKARNEIK